MRRRYLIDAIDRMRREKPRESGIKGPSLRASIIEHALHRQMLRQEAAERRETRTERAT